MRAAIAMGTVVLGVSALSAQALQPGAASWTQFRAPDSSFTVMVPVGRQLEERTQDSGYVSEKVNFTDAGTTRFAVRVQSHKPGTSIQQMTDVQTFCVTCLGRVVSDTTIPAGSHTGRWVLVDSGPGEENAKVTSMYRLVSSGRKLYVVSAGSQFGQSPSVDAGWFLDSFRLCALIDPCPVIADGPPPWHASPFKYLPPSGVRSDEAFSSSPDFGLPFVVHQLSKMAMTAPGSPAPIYPLELKARKVEGEVVASFAIDTAGVAEMNTLKILKSTDPAFAEAVRVALPQMRFIPAIVGGKKVRHLVEQQPFVFTIAK